MITRKGFAVAVLAASLALPLATEATRSTGMLSAQWAWALDMDRNEALLFGLGTMVVCGGIANPGAAACGVAGLL